MSEEKSVVTREGSFAASPDQLWELVRDFGGLDKFMPGLEVECDSDEVGAIRRINMGGGIVVESLDARDEEARSLTYSIHEAPLPFADYSASMTVDAEGEGSKLTWTGTFLPAGVPTEKAEQVAGGIYEGGIAGYKKALGE